MSTTRSVIDPKADTLATGYVLPKPGRGTNELLLPDPQRDNPNTLRRHREVSVAKSIGSRLTALAQCQEQFLGELRSCLQELEDSVGEAARVRLQAQVHSALSVLDWCDAVQTDLQNEGQWAERGLQPIELCAFCADMTERPRSDGVSIQVVGDWSQIWWGNVGLLAETIDAGIAVVSQRIGGVGTIVVEVASGKAATIRLAGSGELSNDVDSSVVRVFRQAVERLGAMVEPDTFGPGGAGLVLALPGPRI